MSRLIACWRRVLSQIITVETANTVLGLGRIPDAKLLLSRFDLRIRYVWFFVRPQVYFLLRLLRH